MGSASALLVAHGFGHESNGRWGTLLARLGVEPTQTLVVDNAGGPLADLVGTNSHFEFSGYLEGIEALRSRHVLDDRLLIFNDTLFSHHWGWGWSRLLARRQPRPGVWGDGRVDRIADTDRTMRFLSSWHFDVVGPQALDGFERALRMVIEVFDEPDPDPEYQRHVTRYLNSTAWRGYSNPSGVRSDGDLDRKRACIRAEHRLTARPELEPHVRSYSGVAYELVHAVDRGLSARRRIRNLYR